MANSKRLNRRAYCYAAVGKLQEAINDATQDLQLRLKAHDHIAMGYIDRAQLYTQAKGYEKAILDLNAALAADPGRTSILRERAKVYDLMGKKDLANKDRETALKTEREQF